MYIYIRRKMQPHHRPTTEQRDGQGAGPRCCLHQSTKGTYSTLRIVPLGYWHWHHHDFITEVGRWRWLATDGRRQPCYPPAKCSLCCAACCEPFELCCACCRTDADRQDCFCFVQSCLAWYGMGRSPNIFLLRCRSVVGPGGFSSPKEGRIDG